MEVILNGDWKEKMISEATPTELDINKLPVYQERVFVPKHADLNDAEVVAELYQKLIDRTIGSTEELEKFLTDRNELDAAINQKKAVAFINMTCQTDNQERAEAYKKFTETIEPVVKSMSDVLDKKFLKAQEKYPLDEDRYNVYIRNIRCNAELFSEDNVKLQTEEDLLTQQFQTISGAMTVDFDGQERTPCEMNKLLEEPDRALRESAWRAMWDRRLKDTDKFEDIFDKLLSLRVQIAKNANCKNYRDFKFKEYHRFDYSPDGCKNFHRAIEKTVVPVLKRLKERRAEQMQLSVLRPWDMIVDPKGRNPLKPFETIEEYKKGISEIFGNIDPEFKQQFDEMDTLGLFDLDSRKGKSPIDGYACSLAEARKGFIFGKAVGIDADIFILTHEGGHVLHDLACSNEPLLAYRTAPIEFCEVASLSMELLGMEHYHVFYNTEDTQRSQFNMLDRIVNLLVLATMLDSFQHWIYENPEHSRSDRAEQWVKVHEVYNGHLVDWSGLEKYRQCQWHRRAPLFLLPFYMIEYVIASIGALNLWFQFKEDKVAAIVNYKKALALGGSKPLPQLFEAAGLKFDFSEEMIAPLMEIVVRKLGL